MLSKLIRFGKNRDHADEVLYTIANYYYYQKDTAQAIAFLQKSVKKSTANQEQKGKSYLRLGEIEFDREEYVQAAMYYDSAITYLPNTYENYDQIVARKSILSDLAMYAATVHIEDSLQRLGKLSQRDLDKYLADVKAKKEKEEKRKSRFSSEGGSNSFQQTGFIPEDAISNGLWYFYNPETKSKGYNEFIRVWGDRKLEENWRRSNRSGFFDDVNANTNTPIDSSAILGLNGKNKKEDTVAEDTLKIPRSPEEFMASDKKIANALFGTGEIFKNKLNNPPKAKQAFDELVRRFPNSDYDTKAHYYEYLIYVDQNLTGLAQREKDYILTNYPQSDVAEVLRNAGNTAPSTAPTESVQKLYASTYKSFQEGNYDEVIKNRFVAKSKYPAAFELQQFEFLEAVSYGKLKQFDAYKRALSDIITKYNGGEVKQKAQDYLIAYIQFESKLKDSTANVQAPDTTRKIKDSISSEFSVDTSNLWVLVQLKDKYMNVSDIVDKVQEFNKKHFDDMKIKVNPVFIDGYAVLTIKKFEGMTDAFQYYTRLITNASQVFGASVLPKLSYYIVTPSNFKKIKKTADLETYEKFFNENYFK
jgi:tetratricopeptide (TPR) repeat protein